MGEEIYLDARVFRTWYYLLPVSLSPGTLCASWMVTQKGALHTSCLNTWTSVAKFWNKWGSLFFKCSNIFLNKCFNSVSWEVYCLFFYNSFLMTYFSSRGRAQCYITSKQNIKTPSASISHVLGSKAERVLFCSDPVKTGLILNKVCNTGSYDIKL